MEYILSFLIIALIIKVFFPSLSITGCFSRVTSKLINVLLFIFALVTIFRLIF